MHRIHHQQFTETIVGDLTRGQRARNDANDATVMLQYAVGHRAHNAQAGAAVDQADVALCQHLSQLPGGFDMGRVSAWTGAAVNADVIDFMH